MSDKQSFSGKHLRLTFPRIPVYKKIDEYRRSKAYLSSLEYRNYEWDKPGHEPRLNYYATQRVLHETDQKLKLRREWAKKELIKIEQQWLDLERQEKKFQETFVKMNEFIKSNEDKRARAEIQIREDCALKNKRIQDIALIQEKTNAVIESKKEMDDNVADLRIFKEYLDDVVELTTDFVNADDILSRYEALVSTKNLLAKKQEANLTELEMAKVKITKLSEDYKFKVLGLNNIVADLQSRYNVVSRHALHWENIVLKIKKQCYDKYQDLNKVVSSIWNLYLLMCKRKSETPKFAFEDTEQMLIYIKKTFQEVSTIKEGLRSRQLGRRK